jgi:alkylation response protein AidB-like acyl-CoA dehydrogenase
MDPSITSPQSDELGNLCHRLAQAAGKWSRVSDWPRESLYQCGQAAVFKWFVPESHGGFGWSDRDQTEGYLRLAESDLVTTFVITQYMGAIRRIAASGNTELAQTWLPRLMAGEAFATVGISHLTTSRRHLSEPVLKAKRVAGGFELSGMSPWVTGGSHADLLVVGATLDDGKQILVAVPGDAEGVDARPGVDLVALSASCTDQVAFQNVRVDEGMLLGGPVENVLQSGVGARTGGLQTSTLAVGLSIAASKYLAREAGTRSDLSEPADRLSKEVNALRKKLLEACNGHSAEEASEIRAEANRLVLRSTQAALMAAKGAGFVEGHPVGRWCRQAMFFLVWSCPQPISHAHLCELAHGPVSLDLGSRDIHSQGSNSQGSNS